MGNINGGVRGNLAGFKGAIEQAAALARAARLPDLIKRLSTTEPNMHHTRLI
jgi:hypothetical protein